MRLAGVKKSIFKKSDGVHRKRVSHKQTKKAIEIKCNSQRVSSVVIRTPFCMIKTNRRNRKRKGS
jgi:hypothetical protein